MCRDVLTALLSMRPTINQRSAHGVCLLPGGLAHAGCDPLFAARIKCRGTLSAVSTQ